MTLKSTGLLSFGYGLVAKLLLLLDYNYRARHNAEPPEHGQYVDGATRMIKSYTEADRDLVEAAIMDV